MIHCNQIKRSNELTMIQSRGFTLIELLIVVAIIGILALIVIPNFMTAQIRAKVAASQAEIKTIVDAILQYRVDHNAIPPKKLSEGTTAMLSPTHVTLLSRLTTPINYLDISGMNSPFSPYHGYFYYNWEYFVQVEGHPRTFYWNSEKNPDPATWMVMTLGPNGKDLSYEKVGDQFVLWHDYNPTNGTTSTGIIQKHGR